MSILSAHEVESQISAIAEAAKANKFDLAFLMEVSLWHDVLDAIADGAWDAQDIAKTALSTKSIKFPRQVG